jgi:hypothetical protein
MGANAVEIRCECEEKTQQTKGQRVPKEEEAEEEEEEENTPL